MQRFPMLWPEGSVYKKIKTKVKLANWTSFKIGGPAKFFFEPGNLQSLEEVLLLAKNARMKVFILGSGTNLLVGDFGVDGIVIRLDAKYFKGIYNKDTYITAGSGLKLNQLILFAKEKGLSGLEFLAGIPGTLGGALAGNAGAWGKSIGELVKQAYVLDYEGQPKLFNSRELKFAYRESNLNKYIIISATLKLQSADKGAIARKIKKYLLKRGKVQNNSFPNAGCVFKNPGKKSAGFLIDTCGLKGTAKGGASISSRHANFILNSHKAKSGDVLFLMNLIRKKVKARFRINLEPEIKIWK